MSKPVIIVESPTKAKTIERLLGKQYKVAASMGHVKDLPKSQFGVDILNGFEPKYITIRGKGNIIKQLKESIKGSPKVYLATDPDREGEAISWHLAEILGLDWSDNCRITFHEVTQEAITVAVKNPRSVDLNLVFAQQARRVLDRLVGYMLSPLLWRKVKKGLSAGRVQSVAVRLICDREAEIRNFVSEEYWTLHASLKTPAGHEFQALYYGKEGKKEELKTEAQVKDLIEKLESQSFLVSSLTRKQQKRNPAPPFITSTMQQEAARKLGFTAKKTMLLAQQLYEGVELEGGRAVGLITYIRTDSTRVASSAVDAARKYIAKRFGEEYVGHNEVRDKKRPGVQGAHEAIRPTFLDLEPDTVKPYLTKDQYRLYQLIWDRFLASQMSAAVFDVLSVDIAAGDYVFRASGSTVKFKGYLALYEEGDDEQNDSEEQLLPPDLAEGLKLELIRLLPNQHFTQPPPRYTEAMLVKVLESKGIGRPSTYAPIIDTILRRGYVVRENKRFRPTELGEIVVNLLKEHFPEIIDVEFTANMESDLDKIEEGTLEWRDVVSNFYKPFAERLNKAEDIIGKVELPSRETNEKCEVCGRPMVIRQGRYGEFLACSGFPECKHTKPILEYTEFDCPVCGGKMVERRSKRGKKFYGCSNYPECKFVVWGEPVNKVCPTCGAFLVERKNRGGQASYKCARVECEYQEQ